MVSVNPVSQAANPEEDVWGLLEGGGIRKFDKFADENPVGSGQYIDRPVGTVYTGVVAENPKSYQAQDYDTKELKTYKNGGAIIEISVVLDTPERLDDEDDGRRIFRLGYIGKAALKQEMDRLGIKKFGIGTQVTVTFTGYKQNTSGRASKLMDIALVPTEFVTTQQQGVDEAMSQAGYVEAAAKAGFPVAVVPVAAVATVAAVAPVAVAPVAVAPVAAAPVAAAPAFDLADAIGKVRMMVKVGIPRQNALGAIVGQLVLNDADASMLDMAEAAAPQA